MIATRRIVRALFCPAAADVLENGKRKFNLFKAGQGRERKKKGERKCGRTDSEDDTSQPLPTGRLNEDAGG